MSTRSVARGDRVTFVSRHDGTRVPGVITTAPERGVVQARLAGAPIGTPLRLEHWEIETQPVARGRLHVAISELIDAYAEWDGEVDTFIHAWEDYLVGADKPCPEDPAGIPQVSDGSCDLCRSKNRC